MKNFYKVFGLAIAIVLTGSVFAQKVEVTNGGFELGIDDGSWTMEANDGASCSFDLETTDVQEGANALIVYSDVLGANDWSSQIFNREWNVESGKSYRLGMWFKDISTGTDTMVVSFTSGHGISYTEYGRVDHQALSKEWQELVLYITSPVTTDGVNDIISMSTHFVGIGACLIDNFTITETQNKGGVVSEDGTKISVEFVEIMTDPAGNEASFNVTVNGAANVVTAVALNADDNTKVDLTLTDAVAAGDAVVVEYTPGTLVSAGGTEITTFTITVQEGVSSISNNTVNNALSLYPNPANDMVYFNVENVTNVDVFNVTGKLVQSATGNVTTLNINELNSGVYFVMVKDIQGKMYTNKLIVE